VVKIVGKLATADLQLLNQRLRTWLNL